MARRGMMYQSIPYPPHLKQAAPEALRAALEAAQTASQAVILRALADHPAPGRRRAPSEVPVLTMPAGVRLLAFAGLVSLREPFTLVHARPWADLCLGNALRREAALDAVAGLACAVSPTAARDGELLRALGLPAPTLAVAAGEVLGVRSGARASQITGMLVREGLLLETGVGAAPCCGVRLPRGRRRPCACYSVTPEGWARLASYVADGFVPAGIARALLVLVDVTCRGMTWRDDLAPGVVPADLVPGGDSAARWAEAAPLFGAAPDVLPRWLEDMPARDEVAGADGQAGADPVAVAVPALPAPARAGGRVAVRRVTDW